MKKTKIGPIESDKKPYQQKSNTDIPIFDNMKPGDSFYYQGARNTVIIKFLYYCAKGLYRTEKEGDGWRFHLLKKPKRG